MKRNLPYTMGRELAFQPVQKGNGAPRRFAKARQVVGRHSFWIARILFLAFLFLLSERLVFAQSCPTSGTHSQSTNENTYFAAPAGTWAAGTKTVTLNAVAAGYGTTGISIGDQVLIIQMQGVEYKQLNSSSFGSGFSAGNGSGMLTTLNSAGQMEFGIAASAVPITGGTLTLNAGTTYSYINSAFGTDGQYTYQVIRVPSFWNITLTSAISTPLWNGSEGGITVLSAVNNLNFNNQTISAIGAGFRGGAGIKYRGAAGNSKLDYLTLASTTTNGSKGEGIAGTPRFVNNNGVFLDNVVEGYPSGSFARGAPANAAGGGTDADPTANDQNTGGGGGGNGGAGGQGGNGWSSAATTGGKGGYTFASMSPYTTYWSASRFIMGGGGGGGTNNDGTGVPGNGFASSGAAGGGIVIVAASSVSGTGTIDVSGSSANNTVVIDGSGGGGAGGSVLIYAGSGLSNITVNAIGGNGGSNDPGNVSATQHGPGGGGGGGVIYSNAALAAGSSAAAGIAGISVSTSITNNYGAINGQVGFITSNVSLVQLPPNMLICQSPIILPVILDNLNANYQSNHEVVVAWTVSDENNMNYYAVERSTDGQKFSLVGTQSAANSGLSQQAYSFPDNLTNVNSSVLYYRLQLVDASGHISYSKVVAVEVQNHTQAQIALYPNPAVDFAVLSIPSENQGQANMRLIDDAGRLILARSFTLSPGNNTQTIDRLEALPRGIYVVQVFYNNSVYNTKLVKQ